MRACVAGRPAVPRKPPYPSPRSGVRSTNKPPPTFKWKEYRLDGAERYNRVMTLLAHEFIRRFLMHVLPAGFHRIRYYGLLTCQTRDRNIARIREPLALPLIPVDAIKAASPQPEEPKAPQHPCPCCGSNMRIIEIFLRGQQPKHKPTPVLPKIRIDTS